MGNKLKGEYESANLSPTVLTLETLNEQGSKEGNLYAEALFDFCKFLGNKGYHINGYDDKQLASVIEKFLNQSEPELCDYCGYEVPNHEEGCKVFKSNIK